MGPDKGKGGKFLVVPPGYEGELPEGYFFIKSKTYRVWVFMRGSIANGLEAAVKNAETLKVYPLAKKDNPPKTEFFSGSDKSFNTVHANDATFYDHINHIIQYEPLDMIDVETRGLFASIGIDEDWALGSLRVTLGQFTTKDDIGRFVSQLKANS